MRSALDALAEHVDGPSLCDLSLQPGQELAPRWAVPAQVQRLGGNGLAGVEESGELGQVYAVLPVVVLAMSSGLWGEAFTNLMSSFIDPSVSEDARERAGYGWRLYPGNTLMTAPGYLDGLRFLNKLHNDGLFHPDWALDNYETRNYWRKSTPGAWRCT